MTMAPGDGAAERAVDLWAMAAELERQFAGYKQRLSERRSICVDDDDDVVVDGGGVSSDEEDEEAEEAAGDAVGRGVRGRMYEAYTRRRDERLRSVWRARMERKEAEVMKLWAQMDAVRAGRSGGRAPTTAEDDDGTAGEEAEDDGEKGRSSDVAAPGRVSGKKHARTRRSFSSANLVNNSRPDVGFRRTLSQEPLPPASAGAEGASKRHGAVIGDAAPKRKTLSGSKGGSVKGRGSVSQAGPKPPRGGLPRKCSPGGMEAVVLPRSPGELAAASDREDGAQKDSSPRPFAGSDNGIETTRAASPESECGSEVVDDGAAVDGATSAGTARADSPESECGSEVVDGAAGGGEVAEAKSAVVEERDAEEIIAVQSPVAEAKLGNGEITSDSETEPSYVFIKKKVVEGEAVRLSDALGAGSDAEPHLEVKNGSGNGDQATTAADADTAAEIGTRANAEESYDELSSFSGTGRSGRDSAPNSAPSCSSQSQSIERLLEEDAALLRKKRQHQSASGRRSVQAASTPPSTRSRGAASAARTSSPRGTAVGFKKRFLSFGKKNIDRDGATITSPASVPASPADCGRGRRRCRTADGPIRRRVLGSSSDAAASHDDMQHGYAASPHACSLQSLVAASPAKSELSKMVPQEKSPKSHRSFFSFRSFNCGRG